MKTAVFVKAGQMAIETIEKPSVIEVDDAIIRVVRACVCGSDLWSYRGDDDKATHSANSGHEIIGIVDEVGSAINTVKKETLLLHHSRMVAVIVQLVVLVLKEVVKDTIGQQTFQVVIKPNMFVMLMLIGL